ncbi:siderophore-interacting protein [Pendulispora rubella]|uniref:Siderophore-interacting protein n=1 Tax=Pendulispora rubella TaxID=2741070 RepID=A0ABZ2L482_9BACT
MTQSLSSQPLPRPPSVRFRTVFVRRIQTISPHMLRITLGGEAISDLVTYGNDQHIKLYFQRPGVKLPEPFTSETFMALPRSQRPTLRTYTIREHRPAEGEVDIDFVLHEDAGPASHWARNAKPGDSLTFAGPRGSYQVDRQLDALWLMADETGLPAAFAILETLPAGMVAHAFFEVDNVREEQPLNTRANVDVVWLYRHGVPPGESDVLIDAVRNTTLPEGKVAAWVACEMSIARSLRHHLTDVRGLPNDRVKWVGYWERGQSEDDAYDEAQRAQVKG